MDENGGHFGHQSGNDYSFLWWIASTKYVDNKIKIIESPEFTMDVTTVVGFTRYALTIPEGYETITRELFRIDEGSYNILFSLPLNQNYIVHMSSGAHTIKGKIKALCIKTN